MKKCIILVRVSTRRQDLTEQEKNLFNYALQHGYDKGNIIVIADKESGIKLTEEERNGLNSLKEYISNDSSIDCVYVWEISRIARQSKILYSIRDFLIEHGIQLKVYEPQFELLNPDKSINENSNLIFALYASLSESEMRQKKQRFKRGKERNAKNARYNGGSIKYGYYIDENKNYCIDEQQAEVVRLIFNLYINTEMSQETITRELINRGLIKYGTQKQFVGKILKSQEYCGKSNKYGYERIYPIIIDNETFVMANKKATTKNTLADKSKNTYYCKSLILCPRCMSRCTANSKSLLYACHTAYYKNDKTCDNKAGVNINAIDSLAWYISKRRRWEVEVHADSSKITEYKSQVDLLENKISIQNQHVSSIMKRLQKNDDQYEFGRLTKEEYQIKISQGNSEIQKGKDQIVALTLQKNNIEKIIDNINSKSAYRYDSKEEFDDFFANIVDDEIRYNIIHEIILYIIVNDFDGRKIKKIRVVDIYGQEYNFLYYCFHKKFMQKINGNPDDICFEIGGDYYKSIDVEFLQRFNYNYEYRRGLVRKYRENMKQKNL